MRFAVLCSVIILLALSGCRDETIHYIEAQTSFPTMDQVDMSAGYNSVRDPHQLLIIHETCKKIGYKKLLARYQDDFHWITSRPLHPWMDSLILSYGIDSMQERYYREFWQRRRKEHNEKEVYHILREVRAALYDTVDIACDPKLTNDTLYALVLINSNKHSKTKTELLADFSTLRKLGFHQSAYNILQHYQEYTKADRDEWNRFEQQAEALRQTLTRSDTACANVQFADYYGP